MTGYDATAGKDRAGPVRVWKIRGRTLRLDRPIVMGILNVTPDSFSDGGRHLEPGDALERARRMVEEGADVVDVGGESTRPGAEPVDAAAEWERLAPVLRGLESLSVPVSVDTTKGEVAARALEAGAAIVNDVSGLRFEPAIADLAAGTGAGLVLMHMRGEPRTMQEDTDYDDLVGQVRDFLGRALGTAVERGCDPRQVVLDPGIGFGKSARDNLRLLARSGDFGVEGRPVLMGPSRKSFIGAALDLPVGERAVASAAACVVSLVRGARIFRVHDVRQARRSLDMAAAILSADAPAEGPRPEATAAGPLRRDREASPPAAGRGNAG